MKELQKKQLELDNFIYESNNIKNPGELIFKKIIALDVELSEFMNEVKSFKYWKKNKEIDRNKVIEEACDCLHFILSIANDKKVEMDVGIHSLVKPSKKDINILYGVIKDVLWSDIFIDDKYDNLSYALAYLILIIEILGFTYEDLIKEYDRKYEINIKRQKEGY